MEKNEFLQLVKEQAKSSLITKEELIIAFDEAASMSPRRPQETGSGKESRIAEILYYIGGTIVLLGIGVFIVQHWSTLSSATKILVTLGSGLAAYVVGVLFHTSQKLEKVSQAFFLISGCLTPTGLSVTFDIWGINVGTPGMQSIISAILLLTYLSSTLLFRKNVFLVFSIIFGTWFFFSISRFLIGTQAFGSEKLYEYLSLATGLSYMILGFAFSKDEKKVLTGPLNAFGVLIFLGAAMELGGWTPKQNVFWELIFPGLVFGVILLSVTLKSKAFLTFGTLFLMAYIVKLTAEYFKDSIGWSLSLVIAGLAMIAIGYGSLALNKRYLGR